MHPELKQKLADGSVIAGVVGLGYVGLPLVKHLCDVGYRVLGFDVDETKVEALESGRSYIKHISSEWIGEAVASGKFVATSDFERLGEADCLSVCVPTPLGQHFEPDMRYVQATMEAISKTLRPGQLVILESTTYPGTTVELVRPILETNGLEVGKDYHLAYSPEREDPGNKTFNISTIPKVIGGVTEGCTESASQYYGQIFKEIVRVGSPAVAEFSKLLENIFRSVNIALVNELKMLCDRMDVDVWEVIEAAATKPFGFMPFYPGPGLGGHCIPIDPFYLTWKAKEYGFSTRFIELAGEINTAMPSFVIAKVMEALNNRTKTLRGARVLVLGVAYKKDVDDTRESPAFELMDMMIERGALVDYNDPHVPKLPVVRKHALDLESIPLTPELIQKYDCVLIATAHSSYDFEFIAEHSELLIDTRNATAGLEDRYSCIVKA